MPSMSDVYSNMVNLCYDDEDDDEDEDEDDRSSVSSGPGIYLEGIDSLGSVATMTDNRDAIRAENLKNAIAKVAGISRLTSGDWTSHLQVTSVNLERIEATSALMQDMYDKMCSGEMQLGFPIATEPLEVLLNQKFPNELTDLTNTCSDGCSTVAGMTKSLIDQNGCFQLGQQQEQLQQQHQHQHQHSSYSTDMYREAIQFSPSSGINHHAPIHTVTSGRHIWNATLTDADRHKMDANMHNKE